jgi:hypothetical protein
MSPTTKLPSARLPSARLIAIPPDVLEAVRHWVVAENADPIVPPEGEKVPEQYEYPAYRAIAFLVSKGCTAKDVVNLLKLLRAYGSTATFEAKKKSRRIWIKEAKKLVLTLREVADNIEQFEEKNFGTNLHASPKNAEDIDPPDMDVWDVMRDRAHDLDAFIKMREGPNRLLDEIYTRRLGGTLPFLVTAAELIAAVTGTPHYEEIAILLEEIAPKPVVRQKRKPKVKEPRSREPWTGQAVEKKINRFKQRNPEFVSEFVTANSEEKSLKLEVGKKVKRNPKIVSKYLTQSNFEQKSVTPEMVRASVEKLLQ